jgi:hypothetical protein
MEKLQGVPEVDPLDVPAGGVPGADVFEEDPVPG